MLPQLLAAAARSAAPGFSRMKVLLGLRKALG